MSSAALLDALTTPAVTTEPWGLDRTGAAHADIVATKRIAAPARCDVHAVGSLRRDLSAVPDSVPVVIDLSTVVFLDMAAARFLRSLGEPGHGRRVGLSQLSAAARITYELLDGAMARDLVAVAG